MGNFTCILSHIHTKLNDVTRQDFTGGTLFRAPAQALTVDEGAIAALGVLEIKLARFVIEPNEGMIPGQHLAVKRCVVLSRTTASHRSPNLDWLIQVDMTFLKRV